MDAQGFFIVGYAESTEAIRQMVQMGLNGVVAASTPFDNPSLWNLIRDVEIPVFFPSSYDPDSKLQTMKDFEDAYNTLFTRLPTQYAMMGYEAMSIFSRLFQVCGHDRMCMKMHLDHDIFSGVQGDLKFDEFGDAIRPIFIKKLQRGAVEVQISK